MGEYTFRWEHPAEEVFVTGTFDNWAKTEQLTKTDGVFEKTVALPKSAEKILYKFVADGKWNYNHTAKTETDDEGNVNNVLYPDDIKAHSSDDPTISSVAPGATTAGLAGSVPLEPRSSPPGAFPETPATETPPNAKEADQSVSVHPLPATGGIGNPVSLAPGEQVPDSSTLTGNTVDSNIKLDEASYDKPDASAPVLPAPLSPSSEREAAGEKAIFGGLGPQTSNIIPESSLPMGDNKATEPISQNISSVGPQSTTAELAGRQPIQERSAAPEVVQESQQEAKADPGASANPQAVEEKDEVESELHSKVPEAPATSESGAASSEDKEAAGLAAGGVAAAGAAATAAGAAYAAKDKSLPQSVQDSINNMNNKGSSSEAAKPVESEAAIPQQTAAGEGVTVPAETPAESGGVPEEVLKSEKEAKVDPEAAANPEVVQEKSEVEKELLSKVPESEAKGEPAPTATEEAAAAAATSSSAPEGHERDVTSSVPEEVAKSEEAAKVDPEAAANPTAVQEKAAVESELLKKIPEQTSAGEPAPEAASAAALTSAAPTSTSGAPQLDDPTSGVAPLSIDSPEGESKELNATGADPAVPPTQKENSLPPPASPAPARSRDVSPMTKPAGSSSAAAPTVTTGVGSAEAPAQSKPVGTPRTGAATNSTPQKRSSFLGGKAKGTPESEGSGKKKGFFKRLAEKLK